MNTIGRPEEKDSDRFRTIPTEKLQEIIDAHTQWVTSGKSEGKRCDLHGCNLRNADFSNSNLTEAIFTGADLTGAKFHGSELNRAHLADCILKHTNFVGANLSDAVLSGSHGQGSMFALATLEGTDLRRANFSRANFEEAKIRLANLEQANLENANLKQADLFKSKLATTNLRQADLSHANLKEARSLASDQLGGATVYGALLPEEVGRFDGLVQVTELSKIIKKLFASIIVGCIYSWLTISSTTDAQLVTNSRTSPLPIIQTPIPIASFYGVAPFILSALFLYFQLYLARFWRLLASLPAIFPDGKPLDQKAPPWLPNSIIRAYMPRLRADRHSLYHLEVLISIILTWGAVPFTVALFWLFSLQKHDLDLTRFLILCVSLTSLAAAGFFQLAKLTLHGQETMPLPFKGNWKRLVFYKDKAKRTWPAVTITAIVVLLAFVVSDGAFNGAKLGDGNDCLRKTKDSDLQEKDQSVPFLIVRSYREIVPRFLPCVGARASAELTEEDVSIKPSNWFSRPDEELSRIVQGAHLKNADLRQASARRAFLIKADLRGAQLQEADLSEALLHGANLGGADLQGANLNNAQLQNAILLKVNLQGAELVGAKGEKVNLGEAKLQKANLTYAEFQKADLTDANFEEANLTEVKFQKAEMRRTQLQGAYMDSAELEGAVLIGADLGPIELGQGIRRTVLRRAQLRGANLEQANLKKTDLRGSNLEGVIGLIQDQIDQACVDTTTMLPLQIVRPEPCSEDVSDQFKP